MFVEDISWQQRKQRAVVAPPVPSSRLAAANAAHANVVWLAQLVHLDLMEKMVLMELLALLDLAVMTSQCSMSTAPNSLPSAHVSHQRAQMDNLDLAETLEDQETRVHLDQ